MKAIFYFNLGPTLFGKIREYFLTNLPLVCTK